jgi:hypothetical protein
MRRCLPAADPPRRGISVVQRSRSAGQSVLQYRSRARVGIPGRGMADVRAWMGSVSGIALVATASADGPILGLLPRSLSPASHYRSMVPRDGASMAARLNARSVRRLGTSPSTMESMSLASSPKSMGCTEVSVTAR